MALLIPGAKDRSGASRAPSALGHRQTARKAAKGEVARGDGPGWYRAQIIAHPALGLKAVPEEPGIETRAPFGHYPASDVDTCPGAREQRGIACRGTKPAGEKGHGFGGNVIAIVRKAQDRVGLRLGRIRTPLKTRNGEHEVFQARTA